MRYVAAVTITKKTVSWVTGPMSVLEEATELLGYDLIAVKPPVTLDNLLPSNYWIIFIYFCFIVPLIATVVLSTMLLFPNEWEALPLEKPEFPYFKNTSIGKYIKLTDKPHPNYP